MKRILKTITSFFLALMIVTGSVCFVSAEPEKKPFTHVLLGDSTSFGFALKDFYQPKYNDETVSAEECNGFNCITKDSYPDLMEQYLRTLHSDVKTFQYGVSGARCYDMRYFLDNDYPSDYYIDCFYGGYCYYTMQNGTEKAGQQMTVEELTAYFCELYQTAVREADLITLELGINDLSSWIRILSEGSVEVGLGQYLETFPYGTKARSMAGEMRNKLSTLLPEKCGGILSQDVRVLLDGFTAAYLDATLGMDQLVACIRAQNSEARILVAPVDNLMRGVDFRMGDICLPYGDLMQVLSDMINVYRRTLSPYAGEYYFADFTECDVVRFVDEMREPVEQYTEDAEFLMRKLLDDMGIDLSRVSFEAAAERVRGILCTNTAASLSSLEGNFDFIRRNDDAIAYVETGEEPDAETMAEVREYIMSVFDIYRGYATHPSSQGYRNKFPAYRNAVSTDKTARAYNAAVIVQHIHAVEADAKDAAKTVARTVAETVRSGIRSAIGRINAGRR